MAPKGSVTRWLGALQAGDPAAAQRLWERYFLRLVGLARKKLHDSPRRSADEEDVALSAFDSFFRNAEKGRFPQLTDRDGLWRLLVVITTRKAAHLLRDQGRRKRGGAAAGGGSEEECLDLVLSREPNPEFAAEVAEECQRLLRQLDDGDLESVAVWRMEGHTVEEIAARLGCAPRSVKRKLQLIRGIWRKEGRAVSDTPLPDAESVPLALALRINRACDRFEAAWKTGAAPCIEVCLNGWAEPERSALARELIILDLYYRRGRGEECRAEDYLARFPLLDRDWLVAALADDDPTPGAPPAPLEESADGSPTTTGPPRPAGPLPANLRSFGDYEVLEEIARGGMGVVYKARQIGFNRIVALKMILSGSHAGVEDRARFRIETQAVARLQHPNIVQVYEVGEHEGKPFFSMEFCPGGGLDRKLNGTPLPPAEAARLAATLARAVQAAHDKGVVHRDLKPANVLLAEDGALKVTDFGLAKRMDAAARTQSGAVLGTPSYMAPEQAGGKSREVGPATDVYALGAILYECLTGRPPFKGPTALDTLAQVLSAEAVPPRQLQPKTPRDLETICLKCLEKQPTRRYGTAAELADDLGRWQRGEPVRARPPSLGYVLGKLVRRYRTPLTVAAAMLLLLAAVVTAAFVLLLGAWGASQKNFETADQKGKDLEKKQGELQGALHQKQDALDGLTRQLSVSARIAAGRSDAEYHAGNLRDGLNWMLQAYELAPREDSLRPSYVRLIGARGRVLSGLALWHDGAVRGASFSPDGRTVVTASLGKTARLWDAASGKELKRLTHDGEVFTASFSPDGRTVVTASQDKTARLWDAASGKELQRLTHEGMVQAASFSPDGRTVLTASQDRTARLWDAASGKELQRLTHEGVVLAASFSPDGRTVVTASLDKTARLWDAASGKELKRLTHENVVNAASFSPDGRTVVTASQDKTARLWDAASGKELQRLTHEGVVLAASFSPDGRTVLTASWDNTARLWDAASGKELQRLTHESMVQAASFSSDGRTVVTASWDKTARLWDAASGKELQRLTHEGMVLAASFSPDGRTVVTASWDKTARLWDAASGKELQRLTHAGMVPAASFGPDGRTVLTASYDHTARLWDAASGKELQRLTHDGEVAAASFSPDGRTVVTASWDNTARLWDAASGKELQRLTHEGQVVAASFGPDGRTVLTASLDNTARLWDAASGKELQRLTHDAPVSAASFGPDGRTVVTASWDKTARLWDAASGKELQRLTHEGVVQAASFGPDGRTVLTASQDRTARLWDAASGKELQRLTHEGAVLAASFSPDGRTVLTASFDKTARLWDAASGKELQRLTHEGVVQAASFGPDGRTVLTASFDKTIRLWDAASGRELQRLTHDAPVSAASLSPDGRTVVTASQDKTARLWNISSLSVPEYVDPDRLRAWGLVHTGQDFTAEGTLHPLSKEEYEQQRWTLESKGGDWQPPPDPRQWHLARAAEAEADKAWFAARFHLNRLLLTDPNNPDLVRRRDEAEAHLKLPLTPRTVLPVESACLCCGRR